MALVGQPFPLVYSLSSMLFLQTISDVYLFLSPRSVVDNGLVIDVNVLCQIFEWICALFVISHRVTRHGSLHDTTLTRRWILSLCKTGHFPTRDTKLLGLFLRPLNGLWKEVFSSSGRSGKPIERRIHRNNSGY